MSPDANRVIESNPNDGKENTEDHNRSFLGFNGPGWLDGILFYIFDW